MKPNFLFFSELCLFTSYVLCADSTIHESGSLGNSPFFTRESIIQSEHFDDSGLDGRRTYAELDLNDDGLQDIIISEPASMSGRIGMMWSVFLCVNTNQYKMLDAEICGWPLALDADFEGKHKRIWCYYRVSSWQGEVQYFYIENGECKFSPAIGLLTGDGGTDTGNAIYNAIFKNKWLDFKWTSLDDMPDKTNASARNYKMVDLKNGLTTELLEIGKTSLTFSVEWKLGMEFEEDTLYLMGKLNVESRGWNFIEALYLNPSQWQDIYPNGFSCFPVTLDPVQRKATFEIPYSHIMWSNDKEEKEFFLKKAFFAVRVPVFSNSPDGLTRGRYEEDDEQDDDEAERAGMVKPPPAEDESSDGIPAVESGGGFQPSGQADTTGTTAGSRRYGWLCAGIALALCGVFYFLRKKTSH